MKKAIVIFIILLSAGAWTAKKFVARADKSSKELERFTEYASSYNYDAEIYLTEQVKEHHDEAFAASYRMWKFSPLSELDLSTYYDEKKYYMTLGKIISENAKKDGQTDAYSALLDIGNKYGVDFQSQKSANTPAPIAPTNTSPATDSSLGKPKLGDKRAIPNSRRDDDR